jgi:hypothetical protein
MTYGFYLPFYKRSVKKAKGLYDGLIISAQSHTEVVTDGV